MKFLLCLTLLFVGTTCTSPFYKADFEVPPNHTRVFETPGYPSPAPKQSVYHWRVSAPDGYKLRVACDTIFPPKCGEAIFALSDKKEHVESCSGEKLRYVSKGDVIIAGFYKPDSSKSAVRCEVKSVPM